MSEWIKQTTKPKPGTPVLALVDHEVKIRIASAMFNGSEWIRVLGVYFDADKWQWIVDDRGLPFADDWLVIGWMPLHPPTLLDGK